MAEVPMIVTGSKTEVSITAAESKSVTSIDSINEIAQRYFIVDTNLDFPISSLRNAKIIFLCEYHGNIEDVGPGRKFNGELISQCFHKEDHVLTEDLASFKSDQLHYVDASAKEILNNNKVACWDQRRDITEQNYIMLNKLSDIAFDLMRLSESYGQCKTRNQLIEGIEKLLNAFKNAYPFEDTCNFENIPFFGEVEVYSQSWINLSNQALQKDREDQEICFNLRQQDLIQEVRVASQQFECTWCIGGPDHFRIREDESNRQQIQDLKEAMTQIPYIILHPRNGEEKNVKFKQTYPKVLGKDDPVEKAEEKDMTLIDSQEARATIYAYSQEKEPNVIPWMIIQLGLTGFKEWAEKGWEKTSG